MIMLCYITHDYVWLYNTCYITHIICHVMLYNTYVCYITHVILCYITDVMSYNT